MARLRRILERSLRATGTFRLTKRTFQRVETIGLQLLKLFKQRLPGMPVSQRPKVAVMLHTGRSGSSVLADILNRHPAIHWDGELFNYRLHLWRRRPKARLPEAVRLIERRTGIFHKPIYGFEVLATHLQAGHIRESEFLAALDRLDVERYILLIRLNILRKIVSNLVARQRGRWRLEAGEEAPLTRVYVDVDHLPMVSVKPLVAHIRDSQTEYEALRSMLGSRQYLQLVYEDDVQRDPRRAYRKICDFFEIDYVDLSIRHGRTTPYGLPEVVQNYDDVVRALSATEFEWMLEN